MTHEEMSTRLRVLADCPTLTVENRAELDRIANELAPPRPEPGTVVWYRRTDADPWVLAIVEEDGKGIVFDDRSYLPWFNVYEWKRAYVAPPDTDCGTEALIDELRNRIAELEERQLKPGEVAVKVPHVRSWGDLNKVMLCVQAPNGFPFSERVITRAEAEAREEGR